jgi:hypothetical protein
VLESNTVEVKHSHETRQGLGLFPSGKMFNIRNLISVHKLNPENEVDTLKYSGDYVCFYTVS